MSQSENISAGTKQILTFKRKQGHIKSCPGCENLIGADYRICGNCEEKEKMAKRVKELSL